MASGTELRVSLRSPTFSLFAEQVRFETGKDQPSLLPANLDCSARLHLAVAVIGHTSNCEVPPAFDFSDLKTRFATIREKVSGNFWTRAACRTEDLQTVSGIVSAPEAPVARKKSSKGIAAVAR